MSYRLITGDCLDVLPTLDADSIDACVCDPPYGLSFMGKAWDKGVPSVDVWREVLRILKPGGHLLAFAGTRTQHRMASAIEDAGFEIRDMIAWVYGSGFPKSLDVSKAIDKAAGAEREVTGTHAGCGIKSGGGSKAMGVEAGYSAPAFTGVRKDTPATPEAQQWDGWGTALKPALEPITVARKPLAKGNTVAANVLQHGTGAINVDGCRVGTGEDTRRNARGGDNGMNGESTFKIRERRADEKPMPQGRWPANLIHDGSDEVTRLFPANVKGKVGMTQHGSGTNTKYGKFNRSEQSFVKDGTGDSGSAARFFYCAKASKRDRDEGVEAKQVFGDDGGTYQGLSDSNKPSRNIHPTVKPTDLMRYLVRLVTPPGGVVLDPYTGSGSTGKAAVLEGFDFIGIELDPEYVEIARARIEYAQKQKQEELF